MGRILLLLGALALTACSTQPLKDTTPAPAPTYSDETSESRIDYVAIQRFLGLEKNKEDLGLVEKAFNTCDMGYGYSKSQNCRTEFMTVINFRLLCRDSEGTISNILSDNDITPLDRRQIRWNLKGIQGTVQSDTDGFAQIVTTSRSPQLNQRLRLAIGNEFLYMRANEIKKVITPRPWCHQR